MDVKLKSNKKSATDAKHKVMKTILKRPSPPSTPTPDNVMVTPSKAKSPNLGVIFNPLVTVAEFSGNAPTTKFTMHKELIELCSHTEHQDKKNNSNNNTTTGVTTPKRASKISGNVDIDQEESNNNPTIPKNIDTQSENSEESASITNQVQNLISTLRTNEKTEKQELLESMFNVLTDGLSQITTDSVELQTTKQKVMLTRRRLLGSEEGSSYSNKEEERRSNALSTQPNVECDPRAYVVAGINQLNFMGEPWECKWETLTSDTWTFLLLHERVRLIVQLAPIDDDMQLSDLPSNWPITRVALESLTGAVKNWVRMCVPYALEAMRVYLPGVDELDDLPELLERCAAVARVSSSWIRVLNMDYYNLDYKGAPHQLVFKVTNHSFDCEWTVTMAIKMKFIKQSMDMFPFVHDVQMTSETQVRDAPDPRRLKKLWGHLPLNWNHVPKTLWRIYKYLKYIKKRPNNSI